MWTDIVVSSLLITGCLFMVLAALGALRMPDLPMRMHATTKAGALGVGLIMLAVSLHYVEAAVTAKALSIILFILLTAPVAAHVIARAAYVVGVPLWHKIRFDELKGRYDPKSSRLKSPGQDND
jgi:multicomponent Na+:H+ antiporter subunit G